MTALRTRSYWNKRSQAAVRRLSGGRILVIERRRHGLLDVDDIARARGRVATVIDVGANVGQSATRFRAAFPGARIISVEPVQATFEELRRRTAGLRVECHRLALGPVQGEATIYVTRQSVNSSLIPPPPEEVRSVEQVPLDTLDHFLDACQVGVADLIKIDAEGYDLEVLAGGAECLAAGRARFVLVEAGFHRGDRRHPLFDDLRDYLVPFGYRVLGIYEQALELTGEPALRFANVLFHLVEGSARPEDVHPPAN